jgi:hypothetical protein
MGVFKWKHVFPYVLVVVSVIWSLHCHSTLNWHNLIVIYYLREVAIMEVMIITFIDVVDRERKGCSFLAASVCQET